MKARSLTAAGLTTALLAAAPAARGDVKSVWLGVQGATCPKCGFALAKSLNNLEGIARARLIVKPQHMDVRLQPGAWVDPVQMLRLTRKSNLKAVPDDVRLTVSGSVERRGEALVIVLDQMRTPVELTAVPHASAPAIGVQLAGHSGQRVQVEGYFPPGATLTLSVTSFKALADPEAREKKQGEL
jgi:hypothetical protein